MSKKLENYNKLTMEDVKWLSGLTERQIRISTMPYTALDDGSVQFDRYEVLHYLGMLE